MNDLGSKRMMLKIAKGYEALAKHAEQRAALPRSKNLTFASNQTVPPGMHRQVVQQQQQPQPKTESDKE